MKTCHINIFHVACCSGCSMSAELREGKNLYMCCSKPEQMKLTASMNKLVKLHLLSSKQMVDGLFASWPGRVAVGEENISL